MSTVRACQPDQLLGVNPERMAQLVLEPEGVVMDTARAELPWVMAPGGAELTIDRTALAPDQVPLTLMLSALLKRLLQEPGARVGVKVAGTAVAVMGNWAATKTIGTRRGAIQSSNRIPTLKLPLNPMS